MIFFIVIKGVLCKGESIDFTKVTTFEKLSVFGRYGDLIKHYEVSLSQMLHDILGHDHIQ